DPRNPVTRKTLEHAHFITRVTVAENDLELPEHSELFLELYPERDEDLHPYAGYYIADHNNQTVFWAAPISTIDLGAHPVNPGTFADQHLSEYHHISDPSHLTFL
ncbi:7240_t:CDS:1, partial [Acaulospora colombiana]